MPKNTLQWFENIGECGIGIETCKAFSTHAGSLKFLSLAVPDKGIEGLGLMQDCTAVETLKLRDTQAPHDLKEMHKDTLDGMIEWLKQCTKLREVNLTDFVSAPDILTPALSEEGIDLEDLQISAKDDCMYVLRDHQDFHAAIGLQTKLQSLVLKSDPDPLEPAARNQLCEALCELSDLRYLELSNLGNLKTVTFNGLSVFTADGLLEFIDNLGPGSRGLVLSIDMASLDASLSSEEQDLIRETLATKVQGRFEYQLVRGKTGHNFRTTQPHLTDNYSDPDVPEFDESDSD